MKKLTGQLLIIAAVILCFAVLNITVYETLTKRSRTNFADRGTTKTIVVEDYLPFEEKSEIYKLTTDFKLEGDLPVLDGATALLPVYSAVINAVYPEDSVICDGGEFAAESAMQYSNTTGAYKKIVDGTADIIFVAQPSAEQLQYAADNGVELEMVPIGREGFVFIVNSENPVESLTVDQVCDIYAGKITNWSEVGGANRRINAIARAEGSGSQTALLSFMKKNGREVHKKLAGPASAAIGFSFRFYVEGIVENSNVKMLALNGVLPTEENIRNESYPIVSNFFAVYRKDNTNPNVQRLLDWMVTEEGQSIVNNSGYVGLR